MVISVKSIEKALLHPDVQAAIAKAIEEFSAAESVKIKKVNPAKKSKSEVWWRCDNDSSHIFKEPFRVGVSYLCPYCRSDKVHPCRSSDVIVLQGKRAKGAEAFVSKGYRLYKIPFFGSAVVLVKYEEAQQ